MLFNYKLAAAYIHTFNHIYAPRPAADGKHRRHRFGLLDTHSFAGVADGDVAAVIVSVGDGDEGVARRQPHLPVATRAVEAEGGLVDVEAVNNGKTYYGQRRQVTIY